MDCDIFEIFGDFYWNLNRKMNNLTGVPSKFMRKKHYIENYYSINLILNTCENRRGEN